ncbi:hypothetical protein VTJ49DRAFT_4309 [Mycothermus thermophilus]|uniref:Uncharacterized protein n=1 Tax=Humicola insolens TaxID=85995 RepID=A0ABR3V5U3_HUMIN
MPVYVVTGARTGIGLEYIRQLSQDAKNIVFALVRDLSSDIAALSAIRDASRAKTYIIECDVSSESSVAALPARLRAAVDDSSSLIINTLINNAAVLHSREESALTLSTTALHSHITTNTLGPALVFRALYDAGLLVPDAVVANISSGVGSLEMLSDGRIAAAITPYSISKAALNMLTVHQAKQLRAAGSRIVVVAIDPGHVKTEMGGPDAVVEIPDSASGVLKVLAGLKEEDSGKFLLYTGAELDW